MSQIYRAPSATCMQSCGVWTCSLTERSGLPVDVAGRDAVVLAGDRIVRHRASSLLLSRPKVRHNPQLLYFTCSLVVMGFMANRLRFHHRLSVQFRTLLHTEMDGVRADSGHCHRRGGGLRRRSALPGYSSQRSPAKKWIASKRSRKSLKLRRCGQKAPGEPARGFSLPNKQGPRCPHKNLSFRIGR